MAINNYVGNHKQWDHVGTITPDIEISEGIRPAEEFKPAAWLPVGRLDKHYEEYFVISAGKVVALDSQGRVFPAGYLVGDPNVVYTQNDVDSGTIDVRTGGALSAAASFAVSTVTDFMGTGATMANSISAPIGIAPYNYWQWAGGDGTNPALYRKHNHNLQSQVAVLCDYYIELPLVPLVQSAADLGTGTKDGSLNIYDFGAFSGGIAKATSRTPLAFSDGAGSPSVTASVRFVDEVGSRAMILAAGDYFVDYDTAIVSVYGTTGQATDFDTGTEYQLTAYQYAAGAAPSTYACAVGAITPGDFVKFDADSNMIVADIASDKFDNVIGQVLAVDDRYPKDALDKVRTAYKGLGVENQMPGSANGGVPTNISYAGAANTVVRINLINR